MTDEDPVSEDSVGAKSKSQLKREMTALQELGERLAKLQPATLERLRLPETLRAALHEYGRLTAHGAKRRQRQYIGSIMRQVDGEDIQRQLHAIEHRRHRDVLALHQIESWRDRIVEGEQASLTELFDRFPQLDRQQLRQLARNAQFEAGTDTSKSARHALFRYLKTHLMTQLAPPTAGDPTAEPTPGTGSD